MACPHCNPTVVKEVPPTTPLKDHYGREIVPGAKVAFNYSGEVRLGVVVEACLKDSKQAQWNRAYARQTYGQNVDLTERKYGGDWCQYWSDYIIVRAHASSKTSRIRSRKNLVVLESQNA